MDEKSIEINTECIMSQSRFKQILCIRGVPINVLSRATSSLKFQYLEVLFLNLVDPEFEYSITEKETMLMNFSLE